MNKCLKLRDMRGNNKNRKKAAMLVSTARAVTGIL
jgi:hypothetical protein